MGGVTCDCIKSDDGTGWVVNDEEPARVVHCPKCSGETE